MDTISLGRQLGRKIILRRGSEFARWRNPVALLSVLTTLLLAVSPSAEAGIINATSGVLGDVRAAIANAVDGDTIVIPAGTATWSSRLAITKAITLQGSGIGRTIIKDGVQSGRFLSWNLVAGKPSRMTGIEFQNGGRTTISYAPTGTMGVAGSNTDGSTFRMDHCKWDNLNGPSVFDTVIGVIDHNTIVLGTFSTGFIDIYGSNWNGASYGDGSWAAPAGFGSSQFLFLEDNTFSNPNAGYAPGLTDALNGGRFVIRHNTMNNMSIQTHGTESGGRERGVRAIELYNNTVTGTDLSNVAGLLRSGVILFHDNTYSGVGGTRGLFAQTTFFNLANYRCIGSFPPWGGADGTNQWDVNHPGGPFYTGTTSGPSSGTTITVSGSPGWTTNQWWGYIVRRTTNLGSATGPNFAEIYSSDTPNTLTYGGGFSGNLTFASGDSLQITKVDQALDQPGRGQGSLITGDTPSLPSGWNNQVSEGCYSWNNTAEGGIHVNFSSQNYAIRLGQHYFNDTQAPGYTPYTYPHPLTLTPSNLRIK